VQAAGGKGRKRMSGTDFHTGSEYLFYKGVVVAQFRQGNRVSFACFRIFVPIVVASMSDEIANKVGDAVLFNRSNQIKALYTCTAIKPVCSGTAD
jgi:hypothetical protein